MTFLLINSEAQTKKNIYLVIYSTDSFQSFINSYSYPDEDLCLFEKSPHQYIGTNSTAHSFLSSYLTNLLVILVINNKKNHKELKENMYKYASINAYFNTCYSLLCFLIS